MQSGSIDLYESTEQYLVVDGHLLYNVTPSYTGHEAGLEGNIKM